jgi:hypothetical protein
MKSIFITILIALAVSANAASIDAILYSKVASSYRKVSSTSFNRYAHSLGRWGARYSRNVNRNALNSVKNERRTIRVGGTSRTVRPYADFEALRWGTKMEHLESHKYVSGAGRYSWGIVTASIGVRTGENVQMRTSLGWAQAKTRQLYKAVRYRHCRRRLFRKKCSWRTKNIARGLVQSEVNLVALGMLQYAHIGALSKLPKRLFANNEAQEFTLASAPILGAGDSEANILYKVKTTELIKAVSALVSGTGTPTLVNNLKGYVSRPRNGRINHSSSKGTFKITLSWSAGVFKVTVVV